MKYLNKIVFVFLILTILSTIRNNTFAISSNFKFVIDTVGIPRFNKKRQEINEDIYNTYNLFCYSSPENLKNSPEQRWKNNKYGKWTKQGGRYKGKGTRGEYYILGTNYNGDLIHNYYFPLDEIPTISPTSWIFYDNPKALSSWKNKDNYKYIEQLEFMKNSNLLFNDLRNKEKAMNPYLMKTYNITATSIGLNKAKLDTAATWKTNGIIYTKRLLSGRIWNAIFLTPPMAANAELKTELEVEDEYILDENKDEITVLVKYSGSVINASGYADKKHVKEINLSLYINNEKVDGISGSKTMNLGNQYMFKVNRYKFSPNKTHSVKIKVEGYLHTEFAVDGLMQDSIQKEIKIKILPKKIIPINSENVKVLSKISDKLVVSPLAQTINTINAKSVGFTEAGKYVVAKYNLNISKEDIENIKIYIDDKKINSNTICDEIIESINDKYKYVLVLKIPEETSSSLYGMYSLREENNSYFDIQNTDILERSKEPHILKISFVYEGVKYINEIKFDTMDNYLANINTVIAGQISNFNEIYNYEELVKWLKN